LEELNQSLRQRDKVKDDAIEQLSDQLVSLSARLQEIERNTPLGFLYSNLSNSNPIVAAEHPMALLNSWS